MPSLSKQQQKTLNKEYQNWLAVIHALSVMCDGIRPYIEREMRSFHQTLLANLARFPPCACPRLPVHETKGANRCHWAMELKKWHRGGKPKWQQSDSTKWTDPNEGFCEVAKLFMSDLGARAPHVDINNSDTTGLINLLLWCNRFAIPQPLVHAVRQARNTWGHSSSLQLSDVERSNAFQSIEDFLQDPTLAADPDALNALAEIKNLPKDLAAQDVERRLLLMALHNSEEAIKEYHEQTKKERNLKKRSSKRIEKRLSTLERNFKKESEKRGEIEKQLERIKEAEDVKEKQSFIAEIVFIGVLLLGLLINGIKSSKRSRQWFTIVFVFLGLFVLLDPTSYEDGCPTEALSILHPDLRQFNFTSYLNTAREGFVGRKWLFDRIETILDERTKELWSAIIIVGDPGSGKSAIAAHLLCSRSSSLLIHNNILGYHLCKHSDKITQDGGKFVKNLVNMIASRIPSYMESISRGFVIQRVLLEDCSRDPHGCFEQAIVVPLRELKPQTLERKWYFIVVDAIDECVSSNSGSVSIASSITELIRHKMVRLPSWLKLIMTSRNDSRILKHFPKSVKVDLLPSHPSNMRDIDLFITTALYGHSSLFRKFKTFLKLDEYEISRAASSLLRQSQGNFMFVKELLHSWIADPSTAIVESIAPTMGDIHYSNFERAYGTRDNFRSARKILEIVVATFVPLTPEKIFKVLYLQDPKLDYTYSDFMDTLNGLSHFLRYGEGKSVSLYHLTLLEWLTDQSNIGSPYFVDKQKGHLALATYYLKNVNSCFNLSQDQRPVLYLAQHIALGGHFSNFYEEFQKLPSTLITTPIDESQRTLLHLAAAVQNVEVLRLLLPFFSKPADIKDNHGITPAFVAAAQGALDNLKFLLKVGANISHITNPPPKPPYEFHQDPIIASRSAFWSSTLLHAASQNGHLDVVEFLLLKNVSLSERNGVNLTAVQLAAQNGHLEIVILLHKDGAQTDQVALYHAAANGHRDIVEFLLQNASVKDECMRCDGSFYWLGGKTRYQAALIEPKFKASGELKKYRSALWDLAQPKHLKRHVSDFGFVDDKHLLLCQTALHASVLKGHIHVVQVLLSQSDNAIQCTDSSGRTPLHDAVRSNNKAIAEVLLRAGANVLQRCRFNQNLTLSSSDSYRKYTDLNVMEEDQYDADRCSRGSTPMHLAAIYGHNLMAAVLKKYGASYYNTDLQGASSIHIAACHGQTDFIQWMISSSPKMNINTVSGNGSTPLHSAAICGRFLEMSVLIGLGADMKSEDKKGMTALHYTVIGATSHKDMNTCRSCSSDTRDDRKKFKTLVLSFSRLRMWISNNEDHIQYEYIFDKYVNDENEIRVLPFDPFCKTARWLMEHMDATTINQADNLGRTALHLAAENGLQCIVGFLLAHDALPQKENNEGLTPLEVAMKSYEPLASFDVFFCKFNANKKMYDKLITKTECSIPEFTSSIWDLINYLLGTLDYQTAVVHMLFSWKLQLEPENGQKCLLCHAVEERQPHLLLLMLLMGADLSQGDSLGNTPLLAYLHHGGSFTGFILKEFNVYVPIKCGMPFASSPFHLLSYRTPSLESDNFFESNGNRIWILNLYLWKRHGYEIVSGCQDAEGYTPLHRAAQGGNIKAIETFLAWGCDINTLSPDGHTALSLAIKYAGLKADFSPVIGDSTKASKVATFILKEVLKKTDVTIRCDGTATKLTIYHLAAYRGLHEFLYHLLGDLKPQGFDIDCPDKFGVTPLYLAKLFTGDGMDKRLDPWKKVVRLIESYGGTLRFPHRGAEFRLLYIHLYDTSKLLTYINTSRSEKTLELLQRADNLDHCLEMFHAFVLRNESDDFLGNSVLKPFNGVKDSFKNELVSSLSDSKIVSKILLDYLTLEESIQTFKQSTRDDHAREEKEPYTAKEETSFEYDLFSLKNAAMTEMFRKLKKNEEWAWSMTISLINFVRKDLSKHSEFLQRNEKWLSPFTSTKVLKASIAVLHRKLTCEKIASYRERFLTNVRLQLLGPSKPWVWKRKRIHEASFTQSRLPSVLNEITDFPGKYSQFERGDLIQLVKIVLQRRSRFDYLELLAFEDECGLMQSVYRYDFHWSVRSVERNEKKNAAAQDQVKTLVGEMKEDVIATWERNKDKVNAAKNVPGHKNINPR